MEKTENCGRCGTRSDHLHAFRAKLKRRERLCGACYAVAKENRGLTAEQIAAENERWERVYSERFKDPSYYARPLLVMRSSFADFAAQVEVLLCR